MRKLSLLTAAVALIAALTAMSASAALHTGSQTGPLVAANTVINATNSGNVTLTSSFFNTTVTCTSSTVGLRSANYGNSPVTGDVTGLTFTNCSSGCGTANVTVSPNPTTTSPWANAATLTTTTAPNGSLKVVTPTRPVTVATCGLTCSYGSGSGGVTGTMTGGNPAKVVENVSLTDSSCFDTATWNGTYTSAGPLGNGLFTS